MTEGKKTDIAEAKSRTGRENLGHFETVFGAEKPRLAPEQRPSHEQSIGHAKIDARPNVVVYEPLDSDDDLISEPPAEQDMPLESAETDEVDASDTSDYALFAVNEQVEAFQEDQDISDDKNNKHYQGHRGRLRHRFLTSGPNSLADYELLELLLFMAIPRRDIKPLAKSLIEQFGSYGEVLAADVYELQQVKGLGETAIASIKAVEASVAHLTKERVMNRPVISSWDALIDYLRVQMAHLKKEQFRILFLDRKNVLIADEVQSEGTVDHAPVYPREVVKRALNLSASALILVHNHPSGDPKPSKGDVNMTRELQQATIKIGIKIHDHIVVGKKGHASFKSMGLL